MKRGLMRESLGNLVSSERPVDSLPVIYSKSLKMPFSKEDCEGCGSCSSICPTNAIDTSNGWSIDVGKCIFCEECIRSCDHGAIIEIDAPTYVTDRKELIFKRGETTVRERTLLSEEKRRTIGRSISVREVDTGSCNACEIEVNSLFNPFFDAERFGIKIVASPRHADVLLVTGPLVENMREAFIDVFHSTPNPKVIVAMGTCAISGGVFSKDIDGMIPFDIFIPGCPPAPEILIQSLLSSFDIHNEKDL